MFLFRNLNRNPPLETCTCNMKFIDPILLEWLQDGFVIVIDSAVHQSLLPGQYSFKKACRDCYRDGSLQETYERLPQAPKLRNLGLKFLEICSLEYEALMSCGMGLDIWRAGVLPDGPRAQMLGFRSQTPYFEWCLALNAPMSGDFHRTAV